MKTRRTVQVFVRFADRHEQQADLLVGADGLYSVIREQLLGKALPRYSGYTCWRGVAFFEDAHVSPGISSETWGAVGALACCR